MFIVFEGADGVGKTKQARMLCDHLSAIGRKNMYVQDPGHTVLGLKLRAILKDKQQPISPMAQALMFAAARAETSLDISKKLDEGYDVVADRWLLSTLVYQGRLQGVPTPLIHSMDAMCNAGVRPDHTLLFTLPPETALQRRIAEGIDANDRFDTAGIEFQQKLQEAYLQFGAMMPGVTVYDVAGMSPDSVHDLVKNTIGLGSPEPSYQ